MDADCKGNYPKLVPITNSNSLLFPSAVEIAFLGRKNNKNTLSEKGTNKCVYNIVLRKVLSRCRIEFVTVVCME
jgi:hypothetical protein